MRVEYRDDEAYQVVFTRTEQSSLGKITMERIAEANLGTGVSFKIDVTSGNLLYRRSLVQAPSEPPIQKPPVYSGCLQLFPRALRAIAELSARGTKKHGGPICFDRKSTDPDDYRESHSRHVIDGAICPYNHEDDVEHDVQIAWNALAVLELSLRQQETDDA